MRFFFSLIALVGALFVLPATAQVIDVKVPGRAPAASPTDPENIWLLDLSTGGRVKIWLRPDVAPSMVERIKTLTRQHFYDGLTFHRVIEGFMAQTGDPKGDGTGGSDLPDVPAEFNYLPHVRGAVAAARQGSAPNADEETRKKAENSANSQFFIVFQICRCDPSRRAARRPEPYPPCLYRGRQSAPLSARAGGGPRRHTDGAARNAAGERGAPTRRRVRGPRPR